MYFQLYCGTYINKDFFLCGGSDANIIRLVNTRAYSVSIYYSLKYELYKKGLIIYLESFMYKTNKLKKLKNTKFSNKILLIRNYKKTKF